MSGSSSSMSDPPVDSRIAHLRVSSSVKSQVRGSGRLSVTGELRASMTGEGDDGYKVVFINPSSLASGGIAEKAAAIFRVYDTENKGVLEHEGMMSALAELGVLNGLTSKKLTEILSIGSDAAGKARQYTLQEFVSFYERLAHYQAKAARQERIKALSKMPGIPDGAEGNELLKRVFQNYCKYTVGQGRLTYDDSDPKMSSTQFVKLAQDLGMVQPNGPLNVVTVDVIFHKCKPQGGRRLLYPHYLKALSAAAEESKMNVFELIGVLGMQIKPAKAFVAPQPVIFRQETRSMEQSKFKVANPSEAPTIAEEASEDEDGLPRIVLRQPRSMDLEMTDDEDEGEDPKAKTLPATKEKSAPPTDKPHTGTRKSPKGGVAPGAKAPALYGRGGGKWQADLPADAPEWVQQVVGKVGELQEQLDSVNQENQELKSQQQVLMAKELGGAGLRHRLSQSSGADNQGGTLAGADMANLLMDVDKRLKAVETGAEGRRGPKGVHRTKAPGAEGEEYEEDEDELEARVKELEKLIEEELRSERLKMNMREDMKKLAKAAAAAATKTLPTLEQRVTACEDKETKLEVELASQGAKVTAMEGKVKSLSDGLQAEVSRTISDEMSRSLATEVSRLMAPGTELNSMLAGKVEEMTAETGDRLRVLEANEGSNRAKVSTLENSVAEQSGKVDQALALAQDCMQRTVASSAKLASLEAGGDWVSKASSLEAMIHELQRQVKDLQVKNDTLEGEVSRLKGSGSGRVGRDGIDGADGLVSETIVHGEAPGEGGMRRGKVGTADMIAMAEMSGRVMGLETQLRETQQGLVTALAASGISPDAAMKDSGAAAAAAAKHAGNEATLADLVNRLSSVEAKQQEANVTLKKAEALLGGPAAGLAAMGAANAAAANAAMDKKKTEHLEGLIREVTDRIATVESRQREAQAAVSAAMSVSAAVPALETAIQSKLPELEHQIRTQDLNHKQLANKMPEFESFMMLVKSKLPEIDGSAKILEGRVSEQERKMAAADRTVRELGDLIKSLQAEQEGLATNAALSAQLKSQGGAGGLHGAPDGSSMQLILATEERLQRSINTLRDALNNQIAELDGAKQKYDTSLELVQVNFQQLHTRLSTMEGGSSGDGRGGTSARTSDLRDLENHFMDRLRLQTDVSEKMQRAINQLVTDVERMSNHYNQSEQARIAAANAANQNAGRGGVAPEALLLLEQKVEARFTLLGSQFVTIEALRDWEMRFVTSDALRTAQDKARANDEIILQAVKELDKRFHDKMEVEQQVLLRMARQVDVLQNQMRKVEESQGPASSSIKIIRPNAPASAVPNPLGAIPPPLPRDSSAGSMPPGQDPLSILLAQAANAPANDGGPSLPPA